MFGGPRETQRLVINAQAHLLLLGLEL